MPLLERGAVLARIAAARTAAAGGVGQAAAIEGDAGIGKTRLLREIAELDEGPDWSVLAASGGELEQDFAFGVVRQLFERRILELDDAQRAAAFAGAARHALPALTDSDAVVPASSAGLFAALNGLYWLASNLALTHPLLLLVDDAHWIDAASERFLDFLARRIEDMPAVLVVAMRPTGRLALPQAPNVHRIRIEPLTAAAGAVLVRRALGDQSPAVVDACQSATGGNPFLLRELTEALAGSDAITPATVAEVAPAGVSVNLRARMRPLGETAERVASAAAVLGQGAELRHVAALGEVDFAAATIVAADLAAAGILEDADRIDFRHPLLRAAVYGELPAPRRAHEHGRAAELMLNEGREIEAAAHLLHTHGGTVPRTVDVLRHVADDALRRAAPETAVRYLKRALREPPPARELAGVLRRLGTAELLIQDPAAAEHLALALAAETDAVQRVATGRLLAAAYTFASRIDDADALTAQLLAGLDAELRAPVEADRLFMACATGDPIGGAALEEQLAQRTSAVAVGTESANDLLALAARAIFGAMLNRPSEELVALARRAFAGGRLLETEGTEAPTAITPPCTLMFHGHYEEALSCFDIGLETAYAHGSVYGFVHWSSWRAEAAWRCGDLRRAEADARAVLAVEGAVPPVIRRFAAAALFPTLVAAGRLDDAEQAIAEFGLEGSFGSAETSTLADGAALEGRATIRRAQGRYAEARADLIAALALNDRSGWSDGIMGNFNAELAHTQRLSGDLAAAAASARAALAQAETTGIAVARGIALRALGLTQPPAEAVDTLAQAATVLAGTEARLEHAQALVDHGAALGRLGRRADARPRLAEGMDLAQRSGAAALADQAESELRVAGARPRRRALTGIDALTASEHRTAALAVAGHTNREIAQALFLTVKTVEMHLHSVYRKLDVAGRAGLPEELAA